MLQNRVFACLYNDYGYFPMSGGYTGDHILNTTAIIVFSSFGAFSSTGISNWITIHHDPLKGYWILRKPTRGSLGPSDHPHLHHSTHQARAALFDL